MSYRQKIAKTHNHQDNMHDHQTDSEFVGKEPCPKCGSRDNLARYSDGHGWCFGCGHHERGDGDVPRQSSKGKRMAGLMTGEVQALSKRRINEDTCRHFGYLTGKTESGQVCQIAQYRNDDGEIVAQKLRFANKEMPWKGAPKQASPLYGQWLWRDGGKMVVVTEGDALRQHERALVAKAKSIGLSKGRARRCSVDGNARAAGAAAARSVSLSRGLVS